MSLAAIDSGLRRNDGSTPNHLKETLPRHSAKMRAHCRVGTVSAVKGCYGIGFMVRVGLTVDDLPSLCGVVFWATANAFAECVARRADDLPGRASRGTAKSGGVQPDTPQLRAETRPTASAGQTLQEGTALMERNVGMRYLFVLDSQEVAPPPIDRRLQRLNQY